MLVKKFIEYLEFAGQTADMEWFYGNNIIANFIQNHINDKTLISDIKNRITLTTEFDIEKQLSIACKYDNPLYISERAICSLFRIFPAYSSCHVNMFYISLHAASAATAPSAVAVVICLTVLVLQSPATNIPV